MTPASTQATRFKPIARLLHWTMAALIIGMLFVGVGMLAGDPAKYAGLVKLHKSIGVAIFALAVLRLLYRLINPPPPLPSDLPALIKFGAHASHWVLYGLMLALPVVGWAMLSAEGVPIIVFGGLHLPPIVSANPPLFAQLRCIHAALAYGLFLVLLAHIGAALFHGWIRRDGVLSSMASLK